MAACDVRRLSLLFATAALVLETAAVLVLVSGACGPVRDGKYAYVSERILACKRSTHASARAVPWILVAAFAGLIPAWWCTWTELGVLAGDTRAVSKVVFGVLALVALGGMTAVMHYDVGPGGAFRPGHVVGCAVWMSGFFLVHALTLLAYARVKRLGEAAYVGSDSAYVGSEAAYAVLAVVFVALYLLDSEAAASVQWAMFFPLGFACTANLMLGYRLTPGVYGGHCTHLSGTY